MDPNVTNLHEVVQQVIETTSPEHANQLRKQGWVVLSIRKAQDSAGEACLKFVLATQRADGRQFNPCASNDSSLGSFIPPFPSQREQKSSEG